ncbi:Zn-ribbon domain-containing OB-fold protein [Sneathiella sp.]|uniref:Zn-ribbon domain-containing OB-fold protein n=1 Tax=Sneathiella sp. TaxID=1964365 RepID=UPI0025D39E57|nr:OB-fold domain-containing protein [Sneathiella sp.]
MDDAGFWEACSNRRLAFQSCNDCHTLRHPPTPVCPKCRSTHVHWQEAPEIGEIFSFTRIHHASHPAVSDQLPYIVAIVTFPELPGIRFISNVTETDSIHIGMQVRLWWDDIGDGVYIPRFKAI